MFVAISHTVAARAFAALVKHSTVVKEARSRHKLT